MIIDYKADPAHADQHEILDAVTWQPLPMDEVYSKIWYADDQKGILRISLDVLAFESDPLTPLTSEQCKRWEWRLDAPPMCIAWREEHRPIRIVRKERFKEA